MGGSAHCLNASGIGLLPAIEEQTQIPFGFAQGRLSTPLRFAPDELGERDERFWQQMAPGAQEWQVSELADSLAAQLAQASQAAQDDKVKKMQSFHAKSIMTLRSPAATRTLSPIERAGLSESKTIWNLYHWYSRRRFCRLPAPWARMGG
jgi:hypothetical protein